MSIITCNTSYTYDVFKDDLCRLIKEFTFLESGILGHSVLGKEIPFIRFGRGEKKIIITGAHHGKEWITSMLNMQILSSLSTMYNDKKRFGETDICEFFNTHSLYFVPMVNPDGVNLCILGLTEDIPVFTRSRLIGMNSMSEDFIDKWQANIRGVDLNHNYDALFEKGKALAFADGVYGPCASRYSGEHPESEPETKSLVDFTKEINPDIVIAYHSQGEEIFYKFNGKIAPCAQVIAETLARVTGYELIEAAGVTDCSGYKDWVIEKFNIPAFTIEVGKGENPLPLSQFDKIFSDNFKAVLSL